MKHSTYIFAIILAGSDFIYLLTLHLSIYPMLHPTTAHPVYVKAFLDLKDIPLYPNLIFVLIGPVLARSGQMITVVIYFKHKITLQLSLLSRSDNVFSILHKP